jgi:CRISPR/Cas system-associated protein Csm6
MYYIYHVGNKIVLITNKNTEWIPLLETPLITEARREGKSFAKELGVDFLDNTLNVAKVI